MAHRFENGSPESFASRWSNQYVRGFKYDIDVIAPTSEGHAIGNVELADAGFERRTHLAVSDDPEPYFGFGVRDLRGGIDKQIRGLFPIQPPGEQNDSCGWRTAQIALQ